MFRLSSSMWPSLWSFLWNGKLSISSLFSSIKSFKLWGKTTTKKNKNSHYREKKEPCYHLLTCVCIQYDANTSTQRHSYRQIMNKCALNHLTLISPQSQRTSDSACSLCQSARSPAAPNTVNTRMRSRLKWMCDGDDEEPDGKKDNRDGNKEPFIHIKYFLIIQKNSHYNLKGRF